MCGKACKLIPHRGPDRQTVQSTNQWAYELMMTVSRDIVRATAAAALEDVWRHVFI